MRQKIPPAESKRPHKVSEQPAASPKKGLSQNLSSFRPHAAYQQPPSRHTAPLAGNTTMPKKLPTSIFLQATFFTTAGKRSDAFFPRAIICGEGRGEREGTAWMQGCSWLRARQRFN